MLDNKTLFKLRHKTKTTYAYQSPSFPLSLLHTPLFYLLSRALKQRLPSLPTPSCYHAAAVRYAPSFISLALPLCTHICSIQAPSPAPPRSPITIQHRTGRQCSAHDSPPARRGRHRSIESNRSFPLFSFLFSCSLRVLFPSRRPPAELLSARSLPVSHLISSQSNLFLFPLFVHLILDDTFTFATPILDTIRSQSHSVHATISLEVTVILSELF
jgi:hypothetical protein